MKNPLQDILPDSVFEQLLAHNLLNKRVLRDIQIKQQFVELRSRGLSREEAFEALDNEYHDLQYHTLRKIVYSVKLPDE